MNNSWVEEYSWFHSIDFGGGTVSGGRFSTKNPPNYTLYGVFEFLKNINLQGMKCLDIGTMDGIVAFLLKQSGAGQVIATDMAERETFLRGRELLNYDIEYKTPLRIDGLPTLLGSEKLDLIINAGILYHVFDPLESLSICRELLKENGLMILETQYLFDEKRPVLLFNPCDNTRRGNKHANTFWRGSKKAIEGMLEVVGFKVLATKSVNGRLTVLAQACKPLDIQSRHPKIQNIHKSYMNYVNYGEKVDYTKLGKSKSVSEIRYHGKKGNQFIFRSLYNADLPYQPAWLPTRTERAKSMLNDLKFWLGTQFARG